MYAGTRGFIFLIGLCDGLFSFGLFLFTSRLFLLAN